MKKTFITRSVSATMLLFGLCAIMFAQDPGQQTTTSSEVKPTIQFTELTHDFGTIPQGTPVTASFEFKNNSMVPLLISGVSPSCGCTIADYPKEPLGPNTSGKITVTYNAAGQGTFSKSIKVSANTAEGFVMLYIKGTVVPKEEQQPQ
jgi:hypothetical protein